MNSIFQPACFEDIAGLVVALSLRDPNHPAGFSMLPTNTTEEIMQANRQKFAEMLGFDSANLIRANQNHTNIVGEFTSDYSVSDPPRADALITRTPGWLLGVTIADCIGIALYDSEHQAIGIAHSGRKGTTGNIAGNIITKMQQTYNTDPAALKVYLSPCPNASEYPIDLETAKSCDPRYLSPTFNPDEVYYDNRQAVYDQLTQAGVKPENLEVDERSTVSDPELHSYRRDHEQAGRMLLAIGLKA